MNEWIHQLQRSYKERKGGGGNSEVGVRFTNMLIDVGLKRHLKKTFFHVDIVMGNDVFFKGVFQIDFITDVGM
jgi:hypothetical protein